MSEAAIAEETQAAAPATQASQVSEPANDELAEGLALLDEIDGKAETQAETRTEPEKRSTEPEADEDVEAVRQTAREAAAEEARAAQREEDAKALRDQQEREQHQRQLDGIASAFGERAGRIRATLDAIRDGSLELTPELTNAFLNEFNAHHSQSSIVTHKAYWDGTVAFAKEVLPAEAASEIEKGAREGKFRNFGELQRAILDANAKTAQNGRYTEAQVKEREALATLRALKKFQKDPERYTSRTNTAVSRQGVVADGRGDDEKLLDPRTPIAEIDKILARRNGQ